MKKITLLFTALFQIVLTSCLKNEEQKIAVIWTNRTDFVSYCEVFNNSQNKYKIIVEYKEDPADAIINESVQPDIVVGSWLKGKAARVHFSKINNLFGKEKLNKDDFYPELLNLGNISGNQYLLPVSFNLPMIIFSAANKPLIKNDFTLSPDEIKDLSLSFNKISGGVYSKMGFSPRWADDFLYMTAKGFYTSFEETNTFFSWDDKSLKTAIEYLRTWSCEVNTSPEAEDEFKFKYLYGSPFTIIQGGRCLFYYASSKELFSISKDKLENIDFRWLSYNGKTPLKDDILYAGICSKAKNRKAAEAFFIWFYKEETQKKLLERSHTMNLLISEFGLAGGFSAVRTVTEKLFPRYYPLLLSHLPQTSAIYAPHILPSDWLKIKTDIVIPYLKEVCSLKSEITEVPSLHKKVTEWYKNQ